LANEQVDKTAVWQNEQFDKTAVLFNTWLTKLQFYKIAVW
jgi:hypothetical protein